MTLNTIALELVPPNWDEGREGRALEDARKVVQYSADSGLTGRIRHVMIPGVIAEDDDRPVVLKPKLDVLDFWSIIKPELPGINGMCTQVTAFVDEQTLRRRLTDLRGAGMEGIVFVGVPRTMNDGEGSGVAPTEALSIYRELVPNRGVILIPTRDGEHGRFNFKCDQGATYGMTQLLYSDAIVRFLSAFAKTTDRRPEIMLSFGFVPRMESRVGLINWLIQDPGNAAVAGEQEFVKRLAGSEPPRKRQLMVDLYKRIIDGVADLGFPLSIHLQATYGISAPAFETFSEMLAYWSPPNPLSSRGSRFVVARVASEIDEIGSPDRLGIDLDARALGSLVASRATKPPLAIGVYGEWGSGKTFLMRRIEYWIRTLEEAPGPGAARVFEHGIAHVWFSAWHYSTGNSDANLWASLMSNIFTTLHPSQSKREKKIADLLEHAEAAQQIREELNSRLTDAKKAAREAEQKVAEAKQKYHDAVLKAAKLKSADLLDAIKSEDLQSLTTELDRAAQALGLDTAGASARDVAQRAREITELGTRAKILATAGNPFFSPLAVAIYAVLLVGIASWALPHLLGWEAWRSATAAEVGQFAAICAAAAAWIARQASLIRSILRPAEAVQRKIDERVHLARMEHSRAVADAEERETAAAAELTALTGQYTQALAVATAAEAERDGLNGQMLLRQYLSERASSGDYDRYKGVVALVHHDLEQLSDYLTKAVQESAEQAGLRRIVLYIDDLDRCSPQTVTDVLAAVHLLLALPLFTVIVGVDPRWLEKSLTKTHTDLFGSDGATANVDTAPVDYLEKIFQLTYTLPAITPQSCEHLISATLQEALSSSESVTPTASTALPTTGERHARVTSDVRDVFTEAGGSSRASRAAAVTRVIDALTFDELETAAVRQVAPLVSTTPRRAKRFLNAYLVIRARAFAEIRINLRLHADESKGLLVLVALMAGVPSGTSSLFAAELKSPKLSFAEWIDQILSEGTLPRPEASRLQFFRGRPSDLLDLPLSAVVMWRDTARPYATFAETGPESSSASTPATLRRG